MANHMLLKLNHLLLNKENLKIAKLTWFAGELIVFLMFTPKSKAF